MHDDGSPPRARQDGLLEERVGEELLLYDRDSHIAHCLSPVAACVWRHCDGEHDIADIAAFAETSESVVAGALGELREKDLLAAEPQLTQSTGESRRDAIIRMARYGAAAAAGSMIVSAAAATPAMASSSIIEIKEVSGGKCTKAATYNCCICKDADCYTTDAQPECEKFCNEHYGGYVSFTAKMTPF